MRGFPPAPTVLKVLRGNPGKRALPKDEPQMPSVESLDVTPEELLDCPDAAKEWARLAPMLRESRVVTDADRGSLIALCQQWSRYLDANKAIKTAGMVVKSPSGYPMPNPYISISNKALHNCVKLWAELGLTPSSRSRVSTTGGAERSKLDRFVNG